MTIRYLNKIYLFNTCDILDKSRSTQFLPNANNWRRMTEDYIKINRIAYDSLFGEYEKRAIRRATCKSNYEESAESLGGKVLCHARLNFPEISVLEIGPGSGEMLLYFETNGCQTTAIELSTKMAKIAHARSPNTKFIIGNALEVGLNRDEFEIIYAGAIIHLFPFNDALRLLSKIYNSLRPKGFLFINTTLHDIPEEGYQFKSDYGIIVKRFRKRWTEDEFMHALESCNFKIIERLFTDEKDRGKKWIAFICTKRRSNNET